MVFLQETMKNLETISGFLEGICIFVGGNMKENGLSQRFVMSRRKTIGDQRHLEEVLQKKTPASQGRAIYRIFANFW